MNGRDEEAWKEAMVPNPQGQQRRVESINSLLSEPIQSSELLELPPILSKQLPDSVSAQQLPAPAPPAPPPASPTSQSPTAPTPELSPAPPAPAPKEWLTVDWN